VLVGGPSFGFVIERFGFSTMFAAGGVGLALGTLAFFWLDAGRAPRRRVP
jgi:hypothetical protein